MVLQVLVRGRPDGITQTVSVTGDPRFGLQSPIPTTLNVSTPGGKNGTLTNSRTATLTRLWPFLDSRRARLPLG
jgi:hypothetical protein